MKLAFGLPHTPELAAMSANWEFAVTGPEQAAMVKRADELGYDMVSVPEHFVVPHSHLELSGPHYLHSTVAQAFIARYASGWWPFLSKVEDLPARIDFIKSQPTYDGREFDVMFPLGMGRVGEGHVSTDDPNYRPGMTKQQIVDQLCRFAELGVTFSSVPGPRVSGPQAYLDYAQWVIEEVKPQLPAAH